MEYAIFFAFARTASPEATVRYALHTIQQLKSAQTFLFKMRKINKIRRRIASDTDIFSPVVGVNWNTSTAYEQTRAVDSAMLGNKSWE